MSSKKSKAIPNEAIIGEERENSHQSLLKVVEDEKSLQEVLSSEQFMFHLQ